MSPATTGPVASSSRSVQAPIHDEDMQDADANDGSPAQTSQRVTFASQEIKDLSALRSDKRFSQRARSADIGQALQLKLVSANGRPQYYPEYEAARLLTFFQCWVMEWEIGMEGLAVVNPHAKNLGDVIPPWDFIWSDDYLCDPSVLPVSKIPPLPKVNGYEITNEKCVSDGCECEDDECDPRTCACLRRAADCYPYQGSHYQSMFVAPDAALNPDGYIGQASRGEQRSFVYDDEGRLKDSVPFGTPIFECNKNCHCSSSCKNRVVQKGKKAQLAFVKTGEKGWGIQTLETLPKGTFVGAYGGELLNDVEAERRANIYDNQLGTTYLQIVDSHIIKVHLTRQIIEEDLAKAGELDAYRGNAANKLRLVELVTKTADAIEIYEEYWAYLEDQDIADAALYNAEDRARQAMSTVEDDRIFQRAKKKAFKLAEEKAHQTRERQARQATFLPIDASVQLDKDLDHPVWNFLSINPKEQKELRRIAVLRSQMEDECMVTVDSALWGNHTRFFNHSCDPNIYHVPVYTNDASIMRPLLAFFTIREIAANEELCFSYAGNMGLVDLDVSVSTSTPQSTSKGRARTKATMIHPPSTRPGAETEAAITATEADSAAAANRPVANKFLSKICCKCGAPNCTGRVF